MFHLNQFHFLHFYRIKWIKNSLNDQAIDDATVNDNDNKKYREKEKTMLFKWRDDTVLHIESNDNDDELDLVECELSSQK